MHMGRGGPNPGLLELVRVPLTGAAALRQCPLLPDLGYTRSFWEKVLSLMPSREICTGSFQIQQMFLEGLPRVLTRIKR